MKKWILLVVVLCSNFFAKADGIDSLLTVISKTKVDTTKINCLNQVSFLTSDDDSAKTLFYATKALGLAQKIQFNKGIIQAIFNLAYYQDRFRYDFQTAEKYYSKGIELAKKEKNLALEAFGLVDYAAVLRKQNKYKQALAITKQTLAIYSELKDTTKLTIVYNDLGNTYKNLNQFEQSIQALLKLLQLAQNTNNQKLIAGAYINIGVCYDGNGDYELALKNYLSAIEPAKASDEKNYIASNYGNIGEAYINLKQFDSGIYYLKKALKLHELQQEPRDVALLLGNIASANNVMHNYSEAVNNGRRSITLAKEVNDVEIEAYGYLYIGVAFQGLKNLSAAKENFLLAEKLIDTVNITSYEMQVYSKLSDYYATIKDYENAFNYYHKLTTIRDTIYNAEKHLQISTLQTQYETAEKENALAKSQSDVLQNVVQLQQKNNWLVASGLGILVIALAGFLFWRSAELRRLKEKIEKEKIASEAQDKMHEEKMRISRELHDSIGSQLTFINSSLEHLSPNDVQEIADTKTLTLNTIRELRSIVWLINKEEFFVDELAGKLRDLMKPLQNQKPKIDIICEGKENQKLNANIASNLFRIIQEATNNTIKYAQANSLKILMDTNNAAILLLHIEDDGIGFEYKENNLSFGLKNIVARVANIGGECSIKSSIGKGTRIDISIPIV